MRVIALLAIRNEALYLQRCIDHLHEQGIEIAIIDNESTDDSLKIARRNQAKGVFHVETFPYPGHYDWLGLLQRKAELALSLGADWYIHHDADEIREAPLGFATLKEGLSAADAGDYTAVAFDEFVFVPTTLTDRFEQRDYVAEMSYYYFFEPRPLHRVNAWKASRQPVDLVKSGGHRVDFPGRQIYPQKFALRHYIFLSVDHARRKYGTRVYSKSEIEARGWHRWRARNMDEVLVLPDPSRMKKLTRSGEWDTSEPLRKHLFLAENGS